MSAAAASQPGPVASSPDIQPLLAALERQDVTEHPHVLAEIEERLRSCLNQMGQN